MIVIRAGTAFTLLGLLFSAACGPSVSDTGYTGTWTKPGLGIMTTISIVRHGDGFLFRWGRESEDGRVQVRCDWQGACEEIIDGEVLATYRMRTWVDEESGHLRVECRGLRHQGSDEATQVHYVDELIVRRDGTRLISRMIANDGVEFERKGQGRRVFEKYSDSVIDPPPASDGRD